MGFLNQLFTFTGQLDKSHNTESKELPGCLGHGRLFKDFHPLDIYRYGEFSSFETANDQSKVPVNLMCKELGQK